MTVAERVVACKGLGEVVRVVDEAARAQVREFKERLLGEALRRWVEAHLGPQGR